MYLRYEIKESRIIMCRTIQVIREIAYDKSSGSNNNTWFEDSWLLLRAS